MVIKFTINKRRRGGVNNKFNPRLSSYWTDCYKSMFKGWKL